MSFDIGRRSVLLAMKCILIMQQNTAARWHFKGKISDVIYFEKNDFQWLAKNDAPDSLSSFLTFGCHSSLF